jgi:hypothetical protein
MFILLETWPEAQDTTPACSEEGFALVFNTFEAAFEYGEDNLQNPVVVDINAGRQHAQTEKDFRSLIAYTESLGLTSDELDDPVSDASEAKAWQAEEDAIIAGSPTSNTPGANVAAKLRYVFYGSLLDGFPVEDCRAVLDSLKGLSDNKADPSTDPSPPSSS